MSVDPRESAPAPLTPGIVGALARLKVQDPVAHLAVTTYIAKLRRQSARYRLAARELAEGREVGE